MEREGQWPLTLWNDILEYLDSRMLWAGELAMPYMCSVGCHIADLRQNDRILNPISPKPPFWLVSGDDESLCLPILAIAPSGMSKTYQAKPWISRGPRTPGLLPRTIIPSKFGGTLTEAGYVGTIQAGENGESILKPGLVDHYRHGIVMFDEASHIFHADKVDRNTDLINNLMRSISERFVSKDLANGPVMKETGITPWFAAQDGRLELTGGFARRVGVSLRYWVGDDVEVLMKNRDKRGGVKDWGKRDKVREGLSQRLGRLRGRFDPSGVVIPEETIRWLHTHCRTHTTRYMVEKYLLGFAVLNNDADPTGELVLEVTPEAELVLLQALKDMKKLAYMEQFVLFGVLRQYIDTGVAEDALWEEYRLVTTYSRTKADFRKRLAACRSEGLARTTGKGSDHRWWPTRGEI